MSFWDLVNEVSDASLKAGFSPEEVKKGIRPHPDLNSVQDPWGTYHYMGGSGSHKTHGITPKKK